MQSIKCPKLITRLKLCGINIFLNFPIKRINAENFIGFNDVITDVQKWGEP